jgi:ketosteroid isomerase-like protein
MRSVASDNVELVRTLYAAWERGDFGSADWADPGIEFVLADGPTPGSWVGVPAMAAAWGALIDSFEHLTVEAEEVRAVDARRVLVLTHNSGRGRASGVDIGGVSTHGANVFHLRDGLVAKLVVYWNRENALADLGLRD